MDLKGSPILLMRGDHMPIKRLKPSNFLKIVITDRLNPRRMKLPQGLFAVDLTGSRIDIVYAVTRQTAKYFALGTCATVFQAEVFYNPVLWTRTAIGPATGGHK